MTLANAVAGPLIERFDMRQSLAGVFKGFELRSVAMAGAGHIDILVAKSTPSDSTFEHGRCLARFSLGWHDQKSSCLVILHRSRQCDTNPSLSACWH